MSTKTDPADLGHMQAALGLARRGLGLVWPNPAVGCVLIKDGRVVGRGWTQPGGRPHAETEALTRAGELARGATAYVTLEPCSHHGKTPPCAEALIAAGISRCFIAVEDPDPRVSGRGVAALQAAGIEVHVGLLAVEAAELNAGFFLRIQDGRPLVALKTATTMDGRIATHGGESQWITGEPARAFGHSLRACYDAVMVGVGTALADNPMLTCRLPGLEDRSPVRILVDSRLRLPLTSHLARTAKDLPTWVITLAETDDARRELFLDLGLELIEVPANENGNPDLKVALNDLAKLGLTRILVEGGAKLAADLLRNDLVDRVYWFRASRLMGGDGMPAVAPFGIDKLSMTPSFTRRAAADVGGDLFELYTRV